MAAGQLYRALQRNDSLNPGFAGIEKLADAKALIEAFEQMNQDYSSASNQIKGSYKATNPAFGMTPMQNNNPMMPRQSPDLNVATNPMTPNRQPSIGAGAKFDSQGANQAATDFLLNNLGQGGANDAKIAERAKLFYSLLKEQAIQADPTTQKKEMAGYLRNVDPGDALYNPVTEELFTPNPKTEKDKKREIRNDPNGIPRYVDTGEPVYPGIDKKETKTDSGKSDIDDNGLTTKAKEYLRKLYYDQSSYSYPGERLPARKSYYEGFKYEQLPQAIHSKINDAENNGYLQPQQMVELLNSLGQQGMTDEEFNKTQGFLNNYASLYPLLTEEIPEAETNGASSIQRILEELSKRQPIQ